MLVNLLTPRKDLEDLHILIRIRVATSCLVFHPGPVSKTRREFGHDHLWRKMCTLSEQYRTILENWHLASNACNVYRCLKAGLKSNPDEALALLLELLLEAVACLM